MFPLRMFPPLFPLFILHTLSAVIAIIITITHWSEYHTFYTYFYTNEHVGRLHFCVQSVESAFVSCKWRTFILSVHDVLLRGFSCIWGFRLIHTKAALDPQTQPAMTSLLPVESTVSEDRAFKAFANVEALECLDQQCPLVVVVDSFQIRFSDRGKSMCGQNCPPKRERNLSKLRHAQNEWMNECP